jgi:hypothetical protein
MRIDQQHAQKYIDYLVWLYKELNDCYSDPNRSVKLPPKQLPSFNEWAANILGMPVEAYLA